MRAIQYDAVGAPPRVVTVPDPQATPDGVVIRVTAAGVCRSDWHAWQGHDPVPLPMIPGHEFAGIVVAVGERVQRVSVGDRVTVPFVLGCGTCRYCSVGDAQVCPQQQQPGFTMPGAFAEYVMVAPADFNVVQLPEGIADEAAAALGCRFATAFRALTTHGAVGRDQWVAVHGAGGVGLSALLIARALGAQVVITDVSPGALALARQLGAAATVDVSGLDPRQICSAVKELTSGGAEVSLDALGSPATVEASLRSLRRRGRHLQVGLLLGDHSTLQIPMDIVVSQELALYGSHGMAAADYPAMLELIASGRVDPAPLIGVSIPLDDAPAALSAIGRTARPGMTVVVP